MSRCDVCGSLGKVHEIMKHKVHDLSERVAKLEARTNAAWGPIEPFELAMSVPSGRACAACLRTLSGNGCCPNRCAQPSAKGLGSAPLASGQLASAGEAHRESQNGSCYCDACCVKAGLTPAEQPSRQETGGGECPGCACCNDDSCPTRHTDCETLCRDRAKAKAAELLPVLFPDAPASSREARERISPSPCAEDNELPEPSGAGQVPNAPVCQCGHPPRVHDGHRWTCLRAVAGGWLCKCNRYRPQETNTPIAEPPAPAAGTLSEEMGHLDFTRENWRNVTQKVAALEARLAQAELFLTVKDKVVAGFEERCKEADKKVAQVEQQSACAKPMAGGRVVCGINGALCNDCWRRLTPVIGVQEQVDAASGPLEFWENEAKEWAAAHDELVAKLAQAERDKASATQSLVDEYDRRKKAERERDAAAEEGRKRHLAAVLRAEHAEELVEKAHARESELAARAREATAKERARCLAWVKLGYSGTRESLQAVDSIRSGAPAPGTGEPNCRDATAGKVEP